MGHLTLKKLGNSLQDTTVDDVDFMDYLESTRLRRDIR
jgi:hypothetical protein